MANLFPKKKKKIIKEKKLKNVEDVEHHMRTWLS